MQSSESSRGIYPRGFPSPFDWPWPLVATSKLVKLNYGKALRDGDRSSGIIPVYGTNGRCGWHNKALASGPGVILGRKGQGPLGVEWCDSDYWVIDTAYFVTTKDDSVDLRYFYYLVKYVGLNHLKDGTSNPSLSRDTFDQLLLPLPPKEIQIEIAQLMNELDRKIELTSEINRTLEAIARAIFKSWFVDFDPVRAKAEGREPDGMDAATAALFPRRFWESSMGPLPEGFEVVELSSACSISMGQSPPGSTYNELEAGMPFYQGRADFTQMFPTRRVYCTEPTRFASKGDVLLSVRAPVGDINIALEDCAIGRGVAAVRHNSASTAYSWCLLKSLEAAFDSFDNEGTVFGAISGKDLKGLRIVSPSPMLVESYTSLCEPLFDKLRANELQSRSLTELRDTLLPRLISGKLRVPEAEAMLSEVV